MLVLIFTRANYAVSRAIGNHVYAAEVRERGGDNFGDRLAGSHVAEETEAVFMPALHAGERVFEDTANGNDEVALVETGAHKGAAHVPRTAEDLQVVSEAPSIPTHCHCPSCSWRYGKGDLQSTLAASLDSQGLGDHSL
jgi:hypothetical protein